MDKFIMPLYCDYCRRQTKQMPVRIEKGEPDKEYFLCGECLSLNSISTEAFKMLLVLAVAMKKVEREWKRRFGS